MTPAIVAVLDDLMFTAKILDAAKRAGVDVVFTKDRDRALALARQQPRLLILDLNLAAFDTVALITALKAEPAPVRVLAYVSHVQVELRQQALDAGADQVLPRSAFVQKLAAIVTA